MVGELIDDSAFKKVYEHKNDNTKVVKMYYYDAVRVDQHI